MGDLVSWLSGVPLTPETAFTAHEKLVSIHPFGDGNGRTGRLLMNLLLLKTGYPPIIIGPEERLAYLQGLEAVQMRGDDKPYGEFMTDRLEASRDRYVGVILRGLNTVN